MAGSRSMSRIRGLFARLFRKLLSISSNSTRSGYLPVEPIEDISRFVVHSSDIQKSTSSLRYKRLLPSPNKSTGRLETSICRSGTLEDEELWAICTNFFDSCSQNPAIGKGTAKASVVIAEGLNFDPNGVPFPQHADIIGWNDEAGLPYEEKKNIWMDQAQRMAPHFKFKYRPNNK